MEISCIVLIKKKDEPATESSASMKINGRTKDCLRIVALLKRRYGKENVL